VTIPRKDLPQIRHLTTGHLVIDVAGHRVLHRRCTRLPGCIRIRNDLYCAGWGI